MGQIIDLIIAFETKWPIRAITAIFIALLWWILAPTISYLIVRLVSFKTPKNMIEKRPFYKPLKVYLRIYGLYASFMFFTKIFTINDNIIKFVKDIYFILSTFLIAKACANGFEQDSETYKTFVKKYPKLDSGMILLILKTIRFIIYAIAVLVIFKYFNIDLSGLIAGLGLGGVVVTIAAQDTAKNLFAGLMVLIDKPFSVGDWIGAENYEGTVEEITFRSVKIRAFDKSVVIIPNSVIVSESIINYSKMYQRRYKPSITLELSTPVEIIPKVCDDIVETLKQNERVIPQNLYAKFDSISDDGFVIIIQVFIKDLDTIPFMQTKQEINMAIMEVLDKYHVNMAYATRTVFLENVK